MKKLVALAVVLALATFACWDASAAAIVKQGANKIAVMGTAQYVQTDNAIESETYLVVIGGEYGHFITDAISLGVRILAAYATADVKGLGDTDVQAYVINFVPQYHFNNDSNIVPYVGPQIAAIYAEADSPLGDRHDTTYGLGALAGINIFLGAQTSLFVEYNLFFFSVDLGGSFGDLDIMSNGINAGIAFWW